jgi:hypothetical protein
MTGYEASLLARAEILEDTNDLVRAITGVLAGARAAGVDRAAVISLAAATRALDPGTDTSYDPGSKHDRRAGGGYRSDGEFLEAAADAEADVAERLREAGKFRKQVAAALEAGQDALAAALTMPVKDECDGCHAAKAAAIADAERRIGLCEAATEILAPLAQRLGQALGRLRQVPEDLSEVYELVYEFIRKGGKLPAFARWIEGERTRT